MNPNIKSKINTFTIYDLDMHQHLHFEYTDY